MHKVLYRRLLFEGRPSIQKEGIKQMDPVFSFSDLEEFCSFILSCWANLVLTVLSKAFNSAGYSFIANILLH